MNTTSNVHVIFGTGPAGSTLAERLHAEGKQVRSVNRSGRATLPEGIEAVAGNVLDAAQVRELCADAAVVYHCANVPYPQQIQLLPTFATHILEGAAHAGA